MMTRLVSTGAHAGAKKRRRAWSSDGAERHEPVEEDLDQEDPGQRGAHARGTGRRRRPDRATARTAGR